MNEQQAAPFSWGAFILVFILTLASGAALNLGAGFLALLVGNQLAGALLGAAPGIILIVVSRYTKNRSVATGILIGACLVAVVGGLCGYSLGEGLNMH